MDTNEMLAEILRANDRSVTITREEGSSVARIAGTFELRRLADALMPAAREVRRQDQQELDALPIGERLASLRRWIEPRKQEAPSTGRLTVKLYPGPKKPARSVAVDVEDLMVGVFRGIDRRATIIREVGSPVARVEGIFDLRMIASWLMCAFEENERLKNREGAAAPLEKVAAPIRRHLAPYE